MNSTTYTERRGELETYFDRTAVDAWAKLTSDAPVSGVRATVRAGRDAMRSTLLAWLPDDLSGKRILDAGCGAGQLAAEAASRGAHVVAVDLSETLVDLARKRMQERTFTGTIEFHVGDMLDPALGEFDHVTAMDSLIHYGADDIVRVLDGFAGRTKRTVLFTVAPQTPLLSVMHAAGKLFPRGDRAPAIAPVSETTLRRHIGAVPSLNNWSISDQRRIQSGFYISNAIKLEKQ